MEAEKKSYLQGVVGVPNTKMGVKTAKRKVETPRSTESASSPTPVQESDGGEMAPRALFQSTGRRS